MSDSPPQLPDPPITLLLSNIVSGRTEAANQLMDCVYEHLRAIAENRMAGERSGHTLQATALVSEAYLRLMRNSDITWRDRGHFYGAAAEAMRRILIDHARQRGASMRGGDRQRLPIDVCDLASIDNPQQILSLDRAFVRLQEHDPVSAEVVRLRFFAGLTIEQTAAVMGISESSVKREWTYARAILFRLLEEESPNDS